MSQQSNRRSYSIQSSGWDQPHTTPVDPVSPEVGVSGRHAPILAHQSFSIDPNNSACDHSRNQDTPYSSSNPNLPYQGGDPTVQSLAPAVRVGDSDQAQWLDRSGPAPESHYTQDTPTFYDAQRSVSYPLANSRQHLTRWDVERGRGQPEREYAPTHPPPRLPRDYSHQAATPLTATSGAHSPLMRGDEGQRRSASSRHPSLQSFGPYTSTVLYHPSRGSSVRSSAESYDHPHNRHNRSGSSGPSEGATHITETSHFVVPSSRLPRTESVMHNQSSDQYPSERVSHSPDGMAETKPKRRRANAAQLQLLNDTYARTMFPSTEERAEIARRINMTPRQVQIWFQNRRQASRQSQISDPSAPPGAYQSQDSYMEYSQDFDNE